MNSNSKCLTQFYQEQNRQIRKEIRELDLSTAYKIPSQNESNKLDYNFIVVGPSGSGKTSLLKTMHYALNAVVPQTTEIIEFNEIGVKKIDIKKGKRYVVEGLTKVKETDRKRIVTGFQFQVRNHHEQSIQYKAALEFIESRSINCGPFFISSKLETIVKLCIFCVDIFQQINFEEANNIKFLKTDLQQKGIKSLVVLTHIDQLLKMKQMQKQAERINFIDFRITDICKDLDIKDREDVICVENYQFDHQKTGLNLMEGQKLGLSNLNAVISASSFQGIHNNEQVNFYSLKLLVKILKQIDNTNKNTKPTKYFKGWFCGCN